MNNCYDINFPKLVRLLLPTFLRKSLIIALLLAIIRPIELIYNQFKSYVRSINIDANSQVCYLQGLLNDMYDYYERRIIVRDTVIGYHEYFIYSEDAGRAVLLPGEGEGNPSLWVDAGKLGAITPDFEVVFPFGYIMTNSEEKALIKKINDNKLASKKYRIIYE